MAGLAADAVMIGHGAFVLLAVFGGVLVLRHWRWAWLHGPAFVWAGWIELTGGICPLTPLENALRVQAGREGYTGDFIARALAPLLYPEGLTREVQIGMGLFVVGLNAVVYILAWRRSGRA